MHVDPCKVPAHDWPPHLLRLTNARPNEITGIFYQGSPSVPTQAASTTLRIYTRNVAHFFPAPTLDSPARTAHTPPTDRYFPAAPHKSHSLFSPIVMATIALPAPQRIESADEAVLSGLAQSVLLGYATHLRVRGIMDCLIQKKEELEAGDDDDDEEEEEEFEEEEEEEGDEEGSEEGEGEGEEEEDDRAGDEPPAKRRKKDDDEDKKKKEEEGEEEEEEEVCSQSSRAFNQEEEEEGEEGEESEEGEGGEEGKAGEEEEEEEDEEEYEEVSDAHEIRLMARTTMKMMKSTTRRMTSECIPEYIYR